MFAAIYIPDFPVEALVRLRPEWRERAVAAIAGTAPLLRVMAVNERAAEAGLECGMTKLQAEEIASACDAVLAMRSVEQEASAQAALLDVAWSFSPRVEDTTPGLVVLDIAGLERIFGPAAKMARDVARRCFDIGLEAQVAVAANPDAAVHAARGFSGVTVVPEGHEQERLATLPVEVLTPEIKNQKSKSENETTPDLLNTLESWGVRNLRALAALPEVAVAERLGQAGLHWQRMARGATRRTLNVAEAAARFEETCELEYPVESLEPLSFVLNRMLEQLCARLSARALATNELQITLALDSVEDLESPWRPGEKPISDFRFLISDSEKAGARPENQKSKIENQKCFCRSLRLPVPMLDAKVFLKLLQMDLQAHPPGAPVVKVAIEARAAEPRRAQNGLFEAGAPEPERLEVTTARIDRVIGRNAKDDLRLAIDDCRLDTEPDANQQSALDDQKCSSRIGVADVLDTHRADAFRMQRFTAAALSRNQKSEIGNRKSATALRMLRPPLSAQVTVRAGTPARVECEAVTGEVTWAAGPWKASGEWWTEEPWAREEWDVCVGGGCYRIYRAASGWFVEGSYD